MPILNVTVSGTPDAARSGRIAARLSDLTRLHLRKDPSLTAVVVSAVAPEHWFAGGRSLAESGQASFWLDIKVVDGTNTKTELADYLHAVFGAMGGLLDAPLHEESYALVHEVPASAYGFGGLSQEHRYVAARLRGGAAAPAGR
jgi:4-oxalocrotonate tautomerase